jgi:hypothetical protein
LPSSNTWRVLEHCLHHARDRIDQVFTIVEHQQQALAPKKIGDARLKIHPRSLIHAQRRGHHLNERARIRRGRELTQPRTIGITVCQFHRALHREACLANATDTGDRDQSRLLERVRQRIEFLTTADK